MSGRIRRNGRWTITPEHLILDPRVSDRAFRLWCRLDRYAGEKVSAFPSNETLAIELNTSPASVQRAKRELIEAGWLKVEQRAGESAMHTLMTAPDKSTMRLVSESRKARKEATEPRREARRSVRRNQKAKARETANVNSSENTANVQVSTGGYITGDVPPDTGGYITSDVGGYITGDVRGYITGDVQKEATLEGSNNEGSSDSSLRSSSADGDHATLPGFVDTPGPDAKVNPVAVAADFLTWFEATKYGGQTVPARQRKMHALAKNYITPALEAGATLGQIKTALSRCDDALPSQLVWDRMLMSVRTGSNVTPMFGRRGYSDAENHGTADERAAQLAEHNAMTPEQIALEAEALFKPRAVPAARTVSE